MEGLIPMVFKAIKKKRIRRQYTSLSSPSSSELAALKTHHHTSHNLSSSDFYRETTTVQNIGGHRRHKSLSSDFAFGVVSSKADHHRYHDGDHMNHAWPPSPPPRQLVRFRSHRMFSCMGAAA
ncbi:uncharacterized protein LOC107415676 [Ziziphus jujuba]|uniref:Uncharacterized protein LOC107415676 n=1 Tax=Ziziphus jujuba TaxID=326968 RepID=A0A6P3ZIK1_ZIZJJ|nr:uncharacterized protein LOC107415676 [Ziziphus jujuba]